MKTVWSDDDERALLAFRRAYEDDGLVPTREKRHWKRAALAFALVAGVQFVVIWAILAGKLVSCS